MVIRVPPPGPLLTPVSGICTGSAAEWFRLAYTMLSEVARPSANVTATPPASTAIRVTAVRVGRANGLARPIVTGRGRPLSRPSRRWAREPCRGRGERPRGAGQADSPGPGQAARPAEQAVGQVAGPRPGRAAGRDRGRRTH